jgi:hypothetical protein
MEVVVAVFREGLEQLSERHPLPEEAARNAEALRQLLLEALATGPFGAAPVTQMRHRAIIAAAFEIALAEAQSEWGLSLKEDPRRSGDAAGTGLPRRPSPLMHP